MVNFSSVDLVETGDTMRAAGLEVISEILESEVRYASLLHTVGNNVANLLRANVTHKLQEDYTKKGFGRIQFAVVALLMCYSSTLY